MDILQYQAFTEQLQCNLMSNEQVLALVALGSMAQHARLDQWSDHDFWVITVPDAQAALLDDLSWLPNHADIVLPVRQAPQYYTVLYRNGHIVEFAVFDAKQVYQGKLHTYQMLFDRQNIVEHIQAVYARTRNEQQETEADRSILGHFLVSLWIGVQHYMRGEKLSGHKYVTQFAMDSLLRVITHSLPTDHANDQDNFDPRRRFELMYPTIGMELDALLMLDVPHMAARLLDIADRVLADALPEYPRQAVAVVRQQIEAVGCSD